MAFIPPNIGTSSVWFSRYNDDIQELLQSLSDNSSQLILAENVRNAIWSLYHEIQLASASIPSSQFYTSASPSTVTVGGITMGSTFSSEDLQSMFDLMLHPGTTPSVVSFIPSFISTQIGANPMSPVTLSYIIDQGASPLISVTIDGPGGSSLGSSVAGVQAQGQNLTTLRPVSTTFSVVEQLNVFTMSVQTADLNTYVLATASVALHHCVYSGNGLVGTTFSQWQSWAANDANIIGLSFSDISTEVSLSHRVDFADGEYLVIAAPSVAGGALPDDGLYIGNIFNTSFTMVRSDSTLVTDTGYSTPYDVWVSDNPYATGGTSSVKVSYP